MRGGNTAAHTAAMDPTAVIAALVVAVILLIAMRDRGCHHPQAREATGRRRRRSAAPPHVRSVSRRALPHGEWPVLALQSRAIRLYPCWLDDEPAKQGITSASAILNHIDRTA